MQLLTPQDEINSIVLNLLALIAKHQHQKKRFEMNSYQNNRVSASCKCDCANSNLTWPCIINTIFEFEIVDHLICSGCIPSWDDQESCVCGKMYNDNYILHIFTKFEAVSELYKIFCEKHPNLCMDFFFFKKWLKYMVEDHLQDIRDVLETNLQHIKTPFSLEFKPPNCCC